MKRELSLSRYPVLCRQSHLPSDGQISLTEIHSIPKCYILETKVLRNAKASEQENTISTTQKAGSPGAEVFALPC